MTTYRTKLELPVMDELLDVLREYATVEVNDSIGGFSLTIDFESDDPYDLATTVHEVRESLRTTISHFIVGPFIPERPEEVKA